MSRNLFGSLCFCQEVPGDVSRSSLAHLSLSAMADDGKNLTTAVRSLPAGGSAL